MADDIIEFKPGIGPFKLNVNALGRRLFKRGQNDPVAVVVQRFLQLFLDHGIAISQIPRLVPQLSLEKLRSIDSLLPALTPDVLESVAVLFGIRVSWLENVDEDIYETLTCYKQPEVFFKDLTTITLPDNGFAVRALFITKTLNSRKDQAQPLALVLVDKIKDIGNEEIFRYRIYGDTWDWSHPPCRIQLKAMARIIFQFTQKPVPLHQVKPEELQAIIDGKCVPHSALQGCLLTNPSLEDFALSSQESAQSKEADELPEVIDYIRNHQLENAAQLLICR